MTALVALSAPGAASAAPAPALPGPWATVNVCDTAAMPNTIGIRGSMPGTGSARDALFIRIQVQYFDIAAAGWRFVGPSADSGFTFVGTGKAKRREDGQDFTLQPRKIAYVLRGFVTFEWRRDGTVQRRARRLTRPGHPATPGADPANAGAGTCEIS